MDDYGDDSDKDGGIDCGDDNNSCTNEDSRGGDDGNSMP